VVAVTTPTEPTPQAVTTRYDSAWSVAVLHTTTPDETAPPAPSTPQFVRDTVTLRLLWNGLGQFGETMPADLDRVEAHLGTAIGYIPTAPADRVAVGFTLASDTFRVDLVAGVPATVSGLTSGTTYYLKCVARDRAGNRSAPSVTATV
jgi:hypothetical protein